MKPYNVVVDAPGIDNSPSLGKRGDDVFVEALVAQARQRDLRHGGQALAVEVVDHRQDAKPVNARPANWKKPSRESSN